MGCDGCDDCEGRDGCEGCEGRVGVRDEDGESSSGPSIGKFLGS